MKKMEIIISLIIIATFTSSLYSQTSHATGILSETKTDTKELLKPEEQEMRRVVSVISSAIGSKLRHPNDNVKKQALLSLITLLGTSEIFNYDRGSRSSDKAGENIGLAGVNFIVDLYNLVNHSDPEISDLARVALDVLFGTENIFIKYMEDPDPTIRKYAIKIYTERCLTAQERERRRGGSENQRNDISLLALRTLLVRLKYEKDYGVKQTITESIEQFLTQKNE